jgi:hypothetical protein
MQLRIDIHETAWWFCAVTLFFIMVALFWAPAYYAVLLMYGIQILYYMISDDNPLTLPVQVCFTYFALASIGILNSLRFLIVALLLIASVRATFFGRCSIAPLLKQLPWNRNRELRCS